MACWTRTRVSGGSRSGLLRALETVCRDTPASSATVARVGALSVCLAGVDMAGLPPDGAWLWSGSIQCSHVASGPPSKWRRSLPGNVGALPYRRAHEQSATGQAEPPVLGVRVGDRQVGGQVRRVPDLGQRVRGGRGAGGAGGG